MNNTQYGNHHSHALMPADIYECKLIHIAYADIRMHMNRGMNGYLHRERHAHG